jgi:hypothetical protein
MADPNEQPARIPNTMPAFTLSLMPVKESTRNLLGLFQLPVGKLMIGEQKVILDEDYIPPSSSVSSHNDLLEIHAGLEQFYAKMEVYSLQIVQRILQKKQNNDMATIIQKLCEHIIILAASHLTEIKTLSLHQPPVHLVAKLCSFARMFKNTLDCFLGTGKEELINYCTEWSEVSQGELESSITDLANHHYDHLDLNNSIEKISRFTHLISNLFANLARLEYIGKRRDVGIFVKEKVIAREPETAFAKRRSFLAE